MNFFLSKYVNYFEYAGGNQLQKSGDLMTLLKHEKVRGMAQKSMRKLHVLKFRLKPQVRQELSGCIFRQSLKAVLRMEFSLFGCN